MTEVTLTDLENKAVRTFCRDAKWFPSAGGALSWQEKLDTNPASLYFCTFRYYLHRALAPTWLHYQRLAATRDWSLGLFGFRLPCRDNLKRLSGDVRAFSSGTGSPLWANSISISLNNDSSARAGACLRNAKTGRFKLLYSTVAPRCFKSAVVCRMILTAGRNKSALLDSQ